MYTKEKKLPALPLNRDQMPLTASHSQSSTSHNNGILMWLEEDNMNLRKEVEKLRRMVVEQDTKIKVLQEQKSGLSQQLDQQRQQAARLFRSIRSAVEAYRNSNPDFTQESRPSEEIREGFSNSDDEWP
ncbi:hypothetical protein B0J13DRAFT_647801 [Dactylonectria estremocensis]|uniref:Uncharacterized protein n=1 Tax=Dactylonectria estremocensis TaxID=1079267 RepID=A0A9P9DMH2_9HYPO|nr:hypothetical protein B0J13DRAFT_647801 [Dactylonectria estremocensis]